MDQIRVVLYEIFEVIHHLLVPVTQLNFFYALFNFFCCQLVALFFHQLVKCQVKSGEPSIFSNGVYKILPERWFDNRPTHVNFLDEFIFSHEASDELK